MKKVLLLSISLLSLLWTYSQSGRLDSSFGKKGWVYIDFVRGNTKSEEGKQVLVQKDGSYILVFGIDDYNTMLARYHPDGSLDSSYGTEGYSQAVRIIPNKAAQQNDGKIVIAGENATFSVARYNTDGSLDSTFDHDGLLTVDFGSYGFANDVALQEDGQIVVAGGAFISDTDLYDFVVTRFNRDGSLDTTFDKDGKVNTNFGNQEELNSISIQNDGKIVVAGNAEVNEAGQHSFALARYNKDGSLDSSFNQNGMLLTDFGGDEKATSMSLQQDGKIVVTGSAYYPFLGNSDIALARYNTDGSLDSTFNKDGKLTTDFGDNAYANSLALQSDGKIVVAGSAYNLNTNNVDFAFARYNADGSLDSTFDQDGILIIDYSYNGIVYSVALQDEGKLIVAGLALDTASYKSDFILFRFNTDGSLDKSFDEDGKVIGYYPVGISIVNAIAHQRDGKVIVAGEMEEDNITHNEDFALARYNTDGTLDSTFDQDGKLTTDFGGDESAFSLAIQDDGKIVVAGRTRDVNFVHDVTLARYNIDGSLDSTFDGDGKVSTDFGGGFEEFRSIVIQGDGKIVAAGRTRGLNDDPDFALARYNTDGSLDSTFDHDGKLTTDFGRDEEATSMSLQEDGQIVVTGITGDVFTSNYDFILARYNTDGSLDRSFNQNGMLTTDFGGEETAASLTIQDDGKIVVAGTIYNPAINTDDFVLARYNVNGTLDSTFDKDGKLTTDFGNYDIASSITLQQDGKIIVAGRTIDQSFSNANFALARYNTEGSLDSSFDGDGKLTADFGGEDNVSSLSIHSNRLYVAGTSYSLTSRGIIAAYLLDAATVTISCPQGKKAGTDRGKCTAVVYDIDPIISDATTANVTYTLTGATTGSGTGTVSGKTFNKGVTTVTYTIASDANKSCSFKVTVQDREVPVITNVSVSPSKLWPPNHKLVDVQVGYMVRDNCGAAATLSVTGNDGATSSDWQVVDAHQVRLRAERSGSGDGRTYTITITATDGSGNKSATSVMVVVPHDKSKNSKNNLQVLVLPNPSQHDFTLQVQSSSDAPIQVYISNAVGKTMETLQNTATKRTLRLGSHYPAGIYYAEVVQGMSRAVVKLVKVSQ